MMEFKREKWGEIKGEVNGEIKGEIVEHLTITDPVSGFSVQLTNYGATIVSVKTPDRNNNVEEITICQDNLEDLMNTKGYLGATIGRVANRIKNGKFTLDGKEYQIFQNNHENSLHGGKEGFNKKIWKIIGISEDPHEIKIEMKYISPDGEENYPGTLTTNILFCISPMKLAWEFKSTTDKATIVNLTNHSYWNLEGVSSSIDEQEIQLNCDKFMITDEKNMVTGKIAGIEKLEVDIREPTKFAEIFRRFGDLDHNFFLEGPKSNSSEELRTCAILYSPKTGRKMIVKTTEPCVQIYTGNFMEGLQARGYKCKKHNAICLETQKPPNAVNFPEFRDLVILKPGNLYFHRTEHIFSIE